MDWTMEIAGSFGDFGTLLPILVSLGQTGQTNLTSSLVVGGIFNILSGLWFQIPICVQPMKAIAAVALSSHLTASQIGTAGFTTSAVILLLAATKLLTPIYRLCPLPLIRGIQLGTGLSLVNKGMGLVLASGGTPSKGLSFWSDNIVVAAVCFVFAMIMYPSKRLNVTAIVLVVYCLVIASIQVYGNGAYGGGKGLFVGPAFGGFLWNNVTVTDFRVGFLNAGLGQIPLTLLNSVFATSKLADDLFPSRARPVASVWSVGIFVGLMNLVGVWFGSMPWCLGSGGLAGQYRFGARTQWSVVFLGVAKIVVGIVAGRVLLPVIQAFPGSVLGVMLVISGVELASAMRDMGGKEGGVASKYGDGNGMLVALVGGSSVMASGNDGIGFVVGAVTAFILWVHEVREERESRGTRTPEECSLWKEVAQRVGAHVKECFSRKET